MQKINKFRINIVIILVFILLVAVLLGFSWNHYRNVIEENEQVSRTQTEIIQLGQDMQEVSDNLTYLVRNYVLTNDISYFKEYWDIVLHDQGREQLLDEIEKHPLGEEEKESIQEIRLRCMELEKREVYAMRLAFQEHNVRVSDYEDEVIQRYIRFVK